MRIVSGTKFAVISDGESILLRPIEKPRLDTFKKLIKKGRAYAQEVSLKKDDVKKSIRKVRRTNHS